MLFAELENLGMDGSVRCGLRASAFLSLLFVLPSFHGASSATLRELTSVQLVRNVPLGAQLKVALELGIRNVRIGLRWNELEKKAGTYDWRFFDERMRPIVGSKLTPIVTLFGGSAAYPKGEGEGGVGRSDEAVAGFARFAAEVAKRYGVGTRGRPITYEIWNEPNTKNFWGSIPDPEAYARLALASCRAIKQSEPEARVVALATEGTPVKKAYTPWGYGIDIYQEWSKRAYTPELAACIDGISIHPYRGDPETYLTDEPRLAAFLAQSWSKPSPPIVVNSEWGYTLSDDVDDPQTLQASRVLRMLLVGAGTGRLTNIYMAMNGAKDPLKKDGAYGLYLYMGRAKPSGEAVKRLLDAIGDYEVVGVEEVEKGSGTYRFEARKGSESDGSVAFVLWTSGEKAEIDVSSLLGKPATEAIDLVSGAPVPAGAAITVSDRPVLVRR